MKSFPPILAGEMSPAFRQAQNVDLLTPAARAAPEQLVGGLHHRYLRQAA